jgi:uncharacterized RDD family membrane protein YckC
VDVVVISVVAVVAIQTSSVLPADLNPSASRAVAIAGLVTVLLGIPITVETATRGRSVGKWLMGLRVVRDDGGPVRFRQALVRALLAIPELYFAFGSVALITSVIHPRGKRVGDLLAGTYVVRERGMAMLPAPPPMPPELATWAANADIAGIPDSAVLAARRLLSRQRRSARLREDARVRLGADLVAVMCAHVAPAPPPDAPAERVLAAILAERRERELAAMNRTWRQRDDRARRRAAVSVLADDSSRLAGQEQPVKERPAPVEGNSGRSGGDDPPADGMSVR